MRTPKGITPLPWRADKCYCGYIWSDDKMVADFPMDEDEGTYIARMRGVGRGATQEEQMANAAFIVHAVNSHAQLVAALGKAARMIVSEYCSHPGPCGANEPRCYADFIYAALAAAKGDA